MILWKKTGDFKGIESKFTLHIISIITQIICFIILVSNQCYTFLCIICCHDAFNLLHYFFL